ncbi:MAG: heavy metal-binding domain-containing protein [Pseudomonadota bacterium]
MEIIILLTLLAFGYFFGQRAEKKHFKSIIDREKAYLKLPVVTMRTPPAIHQHTLNSELVAGNAVISIDFFKKFVASLKMLFGGHVTQYESLLDRARREALLRMKEQAQHKNAFVVLNARVETASISKNSKRRNSVGAVEVLAYGTAVSLGDKIKNEINS